MLSRTDFLGRLMRPLARRLVGVRWPDPKQVVDALRVRWSRQAGSSIWRRFVLYLTAVTGLFLLLTLLIVFEVSLPQASAAARRATDQEIVAHELRQLSELRAELLSLGAAADVLAAVDAAKGEQAERLAGFKSLDSMLHAERTPEGFVAQEEATQALTAELGSVLVSYPYEDEIKALHNRMAVMLALIFVCLVGTMFVFIRDVLHPLEGLIATSREVRSGDLSVTFPMREESYRRDELDELARILNDLLANFQEAFLLIVSLNQEVRDHLEAMGPVLEGVASNDTREALREVHEEALATANEVGEIVGSFEFYSTAATLEEGTYDAP